VAKRGWTLAETARPAVTEGPAGRRTGSVDLIRELCSLGLTQEASLGVLRLLSGPRRLPAAEPCEW
jgi:hypothetical protein